MSVINPTQISAGFASSGALSELESYVPNQQGAAALAQPSDAIEFGNHFTLPIASPVFGSGSVFGPGSGTAGGSAGAGSSLGGYGWIGTIISQLGNIITSLLGQLSGALGIQSSPASTAANGDNEMLYSSASASSKGDPHLSFNGASASGAANSAKWDSMSSHANLLSSDSFAGGYRVSTQATQPNAKGITYNQSATITTDSGAASVTMQKDGSYSVTENGQNVSLTQGTAASLGNGETVTLNADGSLTVDDTNNQGGSIATTLKSNGDGGVDVTTTASNVDLGGYLVDHTDGDFDPVTNSGGTPYGGLPIGSWGGSAAASGSGATLTPIGSGTIAPLNTQALPPVNVYYPPPSGSPGSSAATAAPSSFTSQQINELFNPAQSEAQLGAPMVNGLAQFDPDSLGTSLENIEEA